jgi:hypothetical protein
MIAKIITSVILIAIFEAFTYTNFNKSYAAPYTRLSVSLSEDETQFLPNQLALHLDNQTNGGAVEVISNETGQFVTQYFKYNSDKNSVTVSNSTMTTDFAIQIPDPTNPNTVKISRINLPFLDVQYITKNNETDTIAASTTYYTLSDNVHITIGNTEYNEIKMYITIPNDREQYKTILYIYPSHE